MMTTKTLIAAAALACIAAAATAKIPAPVLDDAAKAKAAEAAAKTAWQAKVDAYQLCKAQDAVAAKYKKSHGGDATVKAAAGPQGARQAAAASKPQAAASGASTPTPATASTPPPCADPGAFAYNPPEQKPLEASGAHSPAGTATSPPSVNKESASMVSGKTGAAPAKK